MKYVEVFFNHMAQVRSIVIEEVQSKVPLNIGGCSFF